MRKLASLCSATILALAILVTPSLAFADDSALFNACKQAPSSSVCAAQGTQKDPVVHVINVTADLFALLAGIAAVIIIIASGIALITSGGNTETVANAKKRITNSLVGLVVIAFAWTIITFATNRLIK